MRQLEQIGALTAADTMRTAWEEAFPGGEPPADVKERWDYLNLLANGKRKRLSSLSEKFVQNEENLYGLIMQFGGP